MCIFVCTYYLIGICYDIVGTSNNIMIITMMDACVVIIDNNDNNNNNFIYVHIICT